MRSLMLLSTAAIVSGVNTSTAQQIRWAQLASGSWNTPANWEAGEIPDSLQELAVIDVAGTYSVAFDRSTLLASLLMPNPNAIVDLHAGDSMYLIHGSASVLTINGLLRVNPTRENRWTEIATCGYEYNYYDYDLLADGSGTIRLNAHPDNLDSARIGDFCTYALLGVGPNQTIAGTGRIELRMISAGRFVADEPASILDLRFISGYPGSENRGELRAENGGILQLRGYMEQNQSWGGGRVVIADALSAGEWNSVFVEGGIIDNSAGGTSTFRGNARLQDVTLRGIHCVAGGGGLELYTGITNDGVLVFRHDEGSPVVLTMTGSITTIAGNGEVFLNGTPDQPTLARIVQSYANDELRFGQGQMLGGSGQVGIDVENAGTLSPGGLNGAIGLIELQSTNWRQEPTSTLVVDLAGPATHQYDRLTRVADLTLAGALVVRLDDGFVPAIGDEFVIMTHLSRTGEFVQVQGPSVAGAAWSVRYTQAATILTLMSTCPTDLNSDNQTSLADLAILLAGFGNIGPGLPADVNDDGRVDLQDLANLLGAFGSSCP